MATQETASASYESEERKETAQTIKEAAGKLREKAGSQTRSILSERKEKLTAGLKKLAGALRETSERLKGDETTRVTSRYVDIFSEKIERASDYLREKDIGELMDEGKRLIHKKPAVVLGGAFVAGIVIARLLKSAGKPAIREWKRTG